jgi:hypothetical protein
VGIEADRGSHTEKGNVIVLHFFVESSDGKPKRSANSSMVKAFFLERSCSARDIVLNASREADRLSGQLKSVHWLTAIY